MIVIEELGVNLTILAMLYVGTNNMDAVQELWTVQS